MKGMGEGPQGALLKGKYFYQRAERGMLKFQVMHSISHSRSVKTLSQMGNKLMLGSKIV